MAEENKNGAESQNIDGVLERLKQSYSLDAEENGSNKEQNGFGADELSKPSEVSSVSNDELQELLKSQFLNADAVSTEVSEDEYVIDEEFLNGAYGEESEKIDAPEDTEDIEQPEFVENTKNIENIENMENIEEEDYGFYREAGEIDKEDAFEETPKEKNEDDEEEQLCQIPQEIQEEKDYEEYQEDEEVRLYEEPQEIQEEEYNEALEEIYETQEDKEIQEGVDKGVQIEFFDAKEEARISAEQNYVDTFYREASADPYDNMSFKEKISETAPSVDALKAALDAYAEEEFTLEEFDDVESIPLILEDEPEEETPIENAQTDVELDRADIALLLEFGYKDEVLDSIPNENIEKLSDEALIDNIPEEQTADRTAEPQKEDRDGADLTKEKLLKRYGEYRKRRGGICLALIVSSIAAVFLLFYELLPLFGAEFKGVMNREEYFFAYLLIGMQIMILAAIPAAKYFYESFRRIFSFGVDAFVVAGISAAVTFIYDLVAIFEINDIPATFHFCAAFIIVLAEVSELMRLNAEIKNYEYYFSEYIFGDGYEEQNEAANIKFTLLKSEGRGSIAEKMYIGGLDSKTVIYAPQKISLANGFFESVKSESRKNKIAFSWVLITLFTAFILTIASGIIYEEGWIAMSAFMITFYMMAPIIAFVAEWLPFSILSSQNYAYGAAFASERASEKIADCDIYVFSDVHLFEKCTSKSVNLAIYDSTSKALLLSCLNAVYSEIEGPLESAFSNVKTQQLGKCKINRVARSGVEAQIGANYSVLIGDEQFMLRYGLVFPAASLGKEEDKIFTLCVSINGRATARIAVRYKLNETFLGIAERLAEDKIACAVETYDPMISTDMVAHLRTKKVAPINIIHKNASDHAKERNEHKEGVLMSALGRELGVLSRGSRLNLAVAVSNAKKLKRLRLIFNIFSGVLMGLGAILSLMFLLSEFLAKTDLRYILLYWLVGIATTVGVMIWKFPRKDRFIFKSRKDSDN